MIDQTENLIDQIKHVIDLVENDIDQIFYYAAGLASLEQLLEDEELYGRLEAKAKRLVEGLELGAKEAGIALQVGAIGSMFGFFFNDKAVKNFDDALKSDTKRFAAFHQAMLSRGFYFACSQFETGFICDAMSDEMIDATIEAARNVFKEIVWANKKNQNTVKSSKVQNNSH